jgi:hypothetical protein
MKESGGLRQRQFGLWSSSKRFDWDLCFVYCSSQHKHKSFGICRLTLSLQDGRTLLAFRWHNFYCQANWIKRVKNSSVQSLTSAGFFVILSGVRFCPLGIAANIGLLYQRQMIDDGDCGAIGGMKIGRGNEITRRKPAPVPVCAPKIPYYLIRARTRTAEMGSQRLTAWAMARLTSAAIQTKQNQTLL